MGAKKARAGGPFVVCRAAYLKPTRSSICWIFTVFAPTAAAHGLQRGVAHLHALRGGPLVVAIGEVVLRFGAGQVLEELDRRGRVLRVLRHRTAGDVQV